jgi:aminoglycoside phosphotransferase (APT) family kinase protein
MAEVERETEKPRTSTRELDDVRTSLTTWLASRLPDGAAPQVGELSTPTSGGMSSETVLFDATWDESGRAVARSLVARLAPEDSAVPVFPRYDLDRQARVIRLVGDRTGVPVPQVRWFESDPGPLGSPFIVMDRVDGVAPPDVMPYNFGSWLMDASRDDQRRLQDASVRILAEIHGVDATADELAFLELVGIDGRPVPGATALRRHVNDLAAYYEWVRGDLRVPVIEAGFAWIDDHWPADEGPAVISWGDSRIGNILYRDFEPVAVLDWEMAAVGPREVDVGWMIFIHAFFEHVAQQIELPGMPHFMRRDDVAATYEAASGVTPRGLDFYELYAALRHAIVMARVTLRGIHFGEQEMPADPDELVLHRVLLREMIGGTP